MIYQLDGTTPDIEPSAWIAESADCIGNIKLKANSSVWFGAVLRGDNELIELGEGSNIQDGCVCHTDPGFPLTIGANVTVGHKAILHGCTIEDDALIGMGATILNGAVIGKGSVIGAGALVGEGKIIPPGVLVVGIPGKIMRELTVEQQALARQGAKRYVENARRFAQGLQKIDH